MFNLFASPLDFRDQFLLQDHRVALNDQLRKLLVLLDFLLRLLAALESFQLVGVGLGCLRFKLK